MKTLPLDAAGPLPLPVPGPARLRRVFEWLVSVVVACIGVYLLLE